MGSLNSERIPNDIQILLKHYDCYDFYFLDKNGNWQKNPRTLREIISCEVWFRIWELLNIARDEEQVLNLFNTIASNDDYPNLILKFKNVLGFTEFADTLATFELLYDLIEYDCYVNNVNQYIPPWDYKTKQRQQEYLYRKNKFEEKLRNLLQDDSLYKSFCQVHRVLKENKFFNFISTIINEEIKFYDQQISFREKLEKKREISEVYELLSFPSEFDIGYSQVQGKSFVRPLIKILKESINLDLPGLQFEIVAVLGALKDPRCAVTLMDLLKNTKPENTNLCSNIIYALGNVRYYPMVEFLSRILRLPDYLIVSPGYQQPVFEIKTEALWAIGKLGILGRKLLPEMTKYRVHREKSIKIALAWAIGMIGAEERNKEEAVDLSIVTTLLELLNENDKIIFEEVLYSLKKIGFYEIIENVNFTNIPATPILSLKPSSVGLYELSETIYHLMSLKKPVVIAVTGDSGTGKTYFCEALKNGFGNISKNDILYLMRDNPAHRTMFSKMIGEEFVKEFMPPQYYTLEMMGEKRLSPAEAFSNFIKQHAHKKLIILDGWLDEFYFYQVLKTFYQNNYLDCIVNFRTNYSTRRINLETREGILERVRDCLSFTEKPPIEETEFYRNGDVFVYNLDNSVGSRLNNEEIKEVFGRKKVRAWADYIRIGEFTKSLTKVLPTEESLKSKSENFLTLSGNKISIEEKPIKIETTHFSRINNENPQLLPHLLQTIKLDKTKPQQIAYYSPGIIAYSDRNETLGLLMGINNQNYFIEVKEKIISNFCIHNELICWINQKNTVNAMDFKKNRLINFETLAQPSLIVSDRNNLIATGERDGRIIIWDINSGITQILTGHKEVICGIVIKKKRFIISNSADGELRIWDLSEGIVKMYNDFRFATNKLGIYPYSNDIILLTGNNIYILNPETDSLKTFTINEMSEATAFFPYYDGRIFVGFRNGDKSVLVVLEPWKEMNTYAIIGFQDGKITGILTMGPRIITTSENILYIWGSELYVRNELEKLRILKESKKRFYYHSMIF